VKICLSPGCPARSVWWVLFIFLSFFFFFLKVNMRICGLLIGMFLVWFCSNMSLISHKFIYFYNYFVLCWGFRFLIFSSDLVVSEFWWIGA
jgi:hypothetical protein